MTCNTFNNPASKQSSLALTPADLEKQIYSYEQLIRLENDPTAKYDAATLVRDIKLTVDLFNSIPNKTDYPMLNDRVSQGPITTYEFASFLDSSGFTISTVDSALLTGITSINEIDYFDQLNYYYTDNMAATIEGGFCSTFIPIINKLTSLISAGVSLISNLQNFIEDVTAQLQSIKQIMFNLIDSLVKAMLDQIKAIMNSVTQIADQFIATVNVIRNKIQRVESFFNDLTIEKLKSSIEALIAGLAGNYEELTPEVIAYLLYRLCQLIETINKFMTAPVDSLKDFIARFAIEKAKFTNLSNIARLESVNSGLYRMDPFTITAMREEMGKNLNAGAGAPDGLTGSTYVTLPISEEEIQLLNSLTESGNQYIEWSPEVLNMGEDVSDADPGDGWKRVNGDVLIRAMRIAKNMNARLYVNSAFRSMQYQQRLYDAWVAKGSPANEPVAKPPGQHQTGKALDISMTNSKGLSNTEEIRNKFIAMASREGIGGIGTYKNMIHIDIGPVRTWGSLQTNALAMHKANAFRTGGTQVTPSHTAAAALPNATSNAQ